MSDDSDETPHSGSDGDGGTGAIRRHLLPHAMFGDDPSGYCGCAGCEPRDDCNCPSCREVTA